MSTHELEHGPRGAAPTRRHAITLVAGATTAASALGACGDGGQDTSARPTDARTSSSTPTPSATTATPAPTTPAGEPAPSGLLLTALAQVPQGQALVVEPMPGRFVAVAQPSAGTAVAFDAACTHKGCPVMFMESALVCHCHGSEFDIATGRRLVGPAKADLPKIDVIVSGGNVWAPEL